MMALILIADDSSLFRGVYSRTLTGAGHRVAEDGYECLISAKKHQPDVILMDVVMPTLNGFQATRQLTKHPDSKHIPVILTSSKNTEPDIIWAMRQGAAAYLVKPKKANSLADADRLLETVDKLLAQKLYATSRSNLSAGHGGLSA